MIRMSTIKEMSHGMGFLAFVAACIAAGCAITMCTTSCGARDLTAAEAADVAGHKAKLDACWAEALDAGKSRRVWGECKKDGGLQ